MTKTDYNFSEERIFLTSFRSSEALKDEIGQRISKRRSKDWDFVQLNSEGAFLSLTFKQKISCN
ncbi:MAG: hypothetical protein E2O79_02540 [Caldithrix sp.]|nr:MAG: hypothetical protein E2O79_02540 [Caldithrix sp.]